MAGSIRQTEKVKKATKGKKGKKEVDQGEEEEEVEKAEEDMRYTCGACGRKVDQDLVRLHRRKRQDVKDKGLDEFDVSSDEVDNVLNGIHPELARILKGKGPEVHQVIDDEDGSSLANASNSDDDVIPRPAVKDVKHDSAFGWIGSSKSKKRPAVHDESFAGV